MSSFPTSNSNNNNTVSAVSAVSALSASATAAAAAAAASLPPIDLLQSELFDIKYEHVRETLYDDIIDQTTSNAVIPDSKTLDALLLKLEKLHDLVERRGSWCDKGMRLTASEKKGHHVNELPPTSSRPESRKDRSSQDVGKKPNKKKRKAHESLAPGDQNTGKPLYPHIHLSLSIRAYIYVPTTYMYSLCVYSVYLIHTYPLFFFVVFVCVIDYTWPLLACSEQPWSSNRYRGLGVELSRWMTLFV